MKNTLKDTPITKLLLAEMQKQGITLYKLHKLIDLPKQSTYDLFKHDSFENNIGIMVKICTALKIRAVISPSGFTITELKDQ